MLLVLTGQMTFGRVDACTKEQVLHRLCDYCIYIYIYTLKCYNVHYGVMITENIYQTTKPKFLGIKIRLQFNHYTPGTKTLMNTVSLMSCLLWDMCVAKNKAAGLPHTSTNE